MTTYTNAAAVSKDAAATEHALRWATSYVQQAERDLDTATMTLDSLAPPDVNPDGYAHHDILVEARAALVQVRTLRRLVAIAYGKAAQNAEAAEREAAGIGQPLPEDEF